MSSRCEEATIEATPATPNARTMSYAPGHPPPDMMTAACPASSPEASIRLRSAAVPAHKPLDIRPAHLVRQSTPGPREAKAGDHRRLLGDLEPLELVVFPPKSLRALRDQLPGQKQAKSNP